MGADVRYASTLRAESNDPTEIQKADFDLLAKINDVASESKASIETEKKERVSGDNNLQAQIDIIKTLPKFKMGFVYSVAPGAVLTGITKFDTSGGLNPSTGVFTCQKSGWYNFYMITLPPYANAGEYRYGIQLTGVGPIVQSVVTKNANIWQSSSSSSLVHLQQSNQVYCQYILGVGNSYADSIESVFSYWYGYAISLD
jgi:hypothetical protein